jgi:methyl-accepting chemotaxis protein
MISLLNLQAAGGASDTGALHVASEIATVVLGLLALVAVIALVVLLLQIRSAAFALRDAARKIEDKADPVLERTRAIAQHVEFISGTVRKDVERLNASVKALSDRLQQASDHMEDRIEEFNALMELVQNEAEDVFIDTASTVRGLKAGAHHLTVSDSARSRPAPREGTPGDADPPAEVDPD